MQLPELATLNWPAFVLAIVAAVLLLVLHRGVFVTLGVCGGLAIGWHLAGG